PLTTPGECYKCYSRYTSPIGPFSAGGICHRKQRLPYVSVSVGNAFGHIRPSIPYLIGNVACPNRQAIAQVIALLHFEPAPVWFDRLIWCPPSHVDDHRPREDGIRQIAKARHGDRTIGC